MGEINTCLHPWIFFVLNCEILCADPITLKCFLVLRLLYFKILLKAGIYKPSKLRLKARDNSFEMKIFLLFFLQKSFIFKIIGLLFFKL